VEVDEVRWVPLAQLVSLLGYKGEKSIAARAVKLLRAADSAPPGSPPEEPGG
jgi:hypothetical protein